MNSPICCVDLKFDSCLLILKFDFRKLLNIRFKTECTYEKICYSTRKDKILLLLKMNFFILNCKTNFKLTTGETKDLNEQSELLLLIINI